MPANTPSTRTCAEREAVSSSTICAMVRTSETGCCGSALRMMRRIAGSNRGWVNGGSHYQVLRAIESEPTVLHLFVGQIDLRLAGFLQAAHADIAHHADHRAVVKRELEVAAQRILVRPVAADEGLAHHRHERPIDGVGFADVAAPPQRDAQRRKESGRHEAHADRVGFGAILRLRVDCDRPDSAAHHHWQEADVGRARDAG